MSNLKKVLTVSGIVLVVVAVVGYATKDTIAQHFPLLGNLLNAKSVASLNTQQNAITAIQHKTLEDANNAIAAAEKALAEADVQTEDVIDNSTTWVIKSNTDGAQPSIPLHEKVKVFSKVKLDPHPEKLPKEGEQVVIPLPNGQNIKANVESIQTAENGDYTWSGHLDGHSDDYPIVMTYGQQLTFATITTPEGSYSMEAADGLGWIYKNPSFAELSKPGGDDQVEVHVH